MPNAGRAEVRSRPRGPVDVRGTITRRACERSLDRAEHARRIASRSVRVTGLRSAGSIWMNADDGRNLTEDSRLLRCVQIPADRGQADGHRHGPTLPQAVATHRARHRQRHVGRERPLGQGAGRPARAGDGVAHAPVFVSIMRAGLGGGTQRRRVWPDAFAVSCTTSRICRHRWTTRVGSHTRTHGSAQGLDKGMKLPPAFIPLMVYRHDVPAREERWAYACERTTHSTAPRPPWSASLRVDDVTCVTTVFPASSQRR